MKQVKGIGASRGIAIGKAYIYTKESLNVDIDKKDARSLEEKKELLKKAVSKTKEEVQILYEKTKKSARKEAEIFQAHLMFLEDPTIIDRIEKLMEQGFSVEASVKRAFDENANTMEKMENPYFRARAKDIRDVSERLIKNILHKQKTDLSKLPYPAIVIAKDLTPSDTASLDKEHVLGFATEMGGVTSHTAILAEALGIPAVVGAKGIMQAVKNGSMIILDGKEGRVIINPDK